MMLPVSPAVALLELRSIARALRVGDTMVKRAPVDVVMAEAVSPGKYLILVRGDEASVEESWKAGREDAGDDRVDDLYLPGVHRDVVLAVAGRSLRLADDVSLGVVELGTVAAALLAADAACKTAPVELLELRLGRGIGGKGVFTLCGALDDVTASVDAACAAVAERRALLGREVIARPDAAFRGRLG